MKIAKAVLVLGLLSFSGCISGVKEPDTYTDHTGKTTLIETDHEACVRSCNDDYSRCMDAQPAESNSSVHGPSGMFGASKDCRNQLSECLPICKGQ